MECTKEQDERRARIIAAAIVTYLDRCGLKRPPSQTRCKTYISAHADLRLRGGIVWKTPGGWLVFTRASYSLDEDQWGLLSL